jgi:hypothetical protein
MVHTLVHVAFLLSYFFVFFCFWHRNVMQGRMIALLCVEFYPYNQFSTGKQIKIPLRRKICTLSTIKINKIIALLSCFISHMESLNYF